MKFSAKLLPTIPVSLIDNSDEPYQIEKKQEDLEAYLNKIIEQETLIFSPLLRQFLQFDHNLINNASPDHFEERKSEPMIFSQEQQVDNYFGTVKKQVLSESDDDQASFVNRFLIGNGKQGDKVFKFGQDESEVSSSESIDRGTKGRVIVTNEYFSSKD